MPAKVVQFIDPRIFRDYYILDMPRFKNIVKAHMLGMAAEAFAYWVDLAKGSLSPLSAEKYINNLFWVPRDGLSIEISVLPDSFAEYIESGYPTFDMRAAILRYLDHKIIAMDVYERPASVVSATRILSAGDIDRIFELNKRNPRGISAGIESKMDTNTRGGAVTRETRSKAHILPSENVRFRTMTNKQHNMWIHPGYQGKHFAEEVVNYMETTLKPKYMDKLLPVITSTSIA